MNLPRLGRVGATGAALRSAAVLVLLAGFVLHARHFGFIQDDSFITFRYIRNFLAGNGLVFNIGEHVEGYTTFLWLILLALAAKVGLNFVPASQIIGLAFGAASLLLTIRLSRETGPPERSFWFSLIAAGLLAANGAVAYWSGSGVETALFTFLTLCCILSYVSENRKGGPGLRTALLFFLLSLTRPEGMMMFGITMGYSLFDGITGASGRRSGAIKRVLLCSAFYLVPMGIFLFWRISYYGFIFPNTFYAKAGISKEYFNAGTDYFLMFADKYLLGGALLLAPIGVLIARRFDRVLLYLFVLVASYTLYVIVVGGDVLPAFRFFIPVIPIVYLFVQEAIYELYRLAEVRKPMNYAVAGLLLLVALVTVVRPYEYLRNAWMGENALVTKMAQTGKWIKGHSAPSAVVAGSTIGALSYYSEDTLVDMLGLTDETIAHHPETIPGVKSSWRERSYNTTYLLSRKPEWICFSTGIKPSAFAERALFTREEFRRWYYPYLFHPGGMQRKSTSCTGAAKRPGPTPPVPRREAAATSLSIITTRV